MKEKGMLTFLLHFSVDKAIPLSAFLLAREMAVSMEEAQRHWQWVVWDGAFVFDFYEAFL